MLTLPTITLWQPWASLIELLEKQNETRSWYTPYRGTLVIHASKRVEHDLCRTRPFFDILLKHEIVMIDDMPTGAILAMCTLADCVRITPEYAAGLSDQERAFGDYTPGRFAWILKDVAPLKKSIPAKGSQKIWNWNATEHLIAIDPWVVGDTKIWTPKGIMTGKQVAPGTEDAVLGLEVAA